MRLTPVQTCPQKIWVSHAGMVRPEEDVTSPEDNAYLETSLEQETSRDLHVTDSLNRLWDMKKRMGYGAFESPAKTAPPVPPGALSSTPATS
ncbi:hypothetical protein NDU88_002993 [Pleurodeles waltl]|uniref:Uncharacterized protein n=1 Tax=Pleurodeles waltl TaxID=8319 RepID=A0AAV7L2T5_PLEWA|nr:hypothetical protein NDU88_002993 [Pleurodeles waltl]